MPQESTEPLAEKEISTLETWIKDGAAWPDETEKLPPTPGRIQAAYKELRVKLWSLQPVTNPAVPAVDNGSWSSNAIDRFVLAKLEEKKLAPVADADNVTLIRRLSYDLTGLPPDPADVKAFRKNHTPRGYRELVDRLLASPQFGERWGRHWLDVARYAESSGPSRNMPYPNAWRYRDYVIDAVNRDIPYNRFIQEQLAGDLLPSDTPAERDRLLTATGFLALGPKDVNQRFKARFKMDNIDDQIDTVTRSTMALTVSCQPNGRIESSILRAQAACISEYRRPGASCAQRRDRKIKGRNREGQGGCGCHPQACRGSAAAEPGGTQETDRAEDALSASVRGS
jgi:hypothetical protein